jgi:hypothetical protein
VVATVSERQPEQAAGGYSENAYTFFLDEEAGELVFGERLDPAQNLATLDEEVPAPDEPESGWGEGVRIVKGRPVRRLSPSSRREPARRSDCLASPFSSARTTAAHRRGQSRERRARPSARRSASPSRDGPSDESGGDGDGPPLPACPDVADHQARPEGSSNSQHGEGFFGGWSIGECGVDTVSYAWRPDDRAALEAFASLPTRNLSRRERGSSMWATQVVDGVQVGAFPGHGLLVTEGRLAPMLSGNERDTRLASPDSLALGARRAREVFAKLGIALGAEPVLRRLDLAGEIRFEHPADGLLFMRTVGGLQLAGHDQGRNASRRQTRAVSWSRGRNIALRLYDAGDHHGTDPPGARLRLERQVRNRKARQQPAEAFTRAVLADLYVAPMRAVIDAAPVMRVLPPRAAELHLVELSRRGDISLAVAERQLGVIRLLELGLDGSLWDAETASRRHRELRGNGVAVGESSDGGAGVDVCAVLVALTHAWRDEARGGQT